MGITFCKIESFNQLPVLPEVLHIRSPKVQSKRLGGIGLDEIKHFITGDVEFLTADQVSSMDREENTIDFRIQRAGMCDLCLLRPLGIFELTNQMKGRAYFSHSPLRPSPMRESKRRAIGSKMLQWGGFHLMKPIDSTLPITNQDLTNETMDHVYMRRTLRFWADYCREPNSFEIQSEETTNPAPVVPQVMRKIESEQSTVVDDWFSIVEQSKKDLQEPTEWLLGMDDIQSRKIPPAEPQVVEPKDITSVETTTGKTTDTGLLDDVSSTTLPLSKHINTSQATGFEAENTFPVSSSSILPSSSSDSTGSDSDKPQSLSPSAAPTSSVGDLKSEAGRSAAEVVLPRSSDWNILPDRLTEGSETNETREAKGVERGCRRSQISA